MLRTLTRKRYWNVLLTLIVVTTNVSRGESIDASSRIDTIIRLDLRQYKLQPNPPVSDIQFVRRVYLDAVSYTHLTLPTKA